MGILDDAIRDHLDLKRRHGAAEEEVRRLEKEAFGPPARPGEPDFPGPDEQEPEGERTGLDLSEFDEELGEEPTRVASAAELAGEAPAEVASEEQATAQQPAEVQPETEEPEPAQGEGPAEPRGRALDAAEREAIAEQPTQIFHQEELEELGIEPEPELEPEADPEAQEPVSEDAAEEELLEQDEEASEEDEEAAAEDEGEDVLEETPDFLRDAPEDDELWFEQGEPKDFDF